jgi:hypothetical protein
VTERVPIDRAARLERLQRARTAAAELVRRIGITAPAHLNLEDVAELLGAKVITAPLPTALAQVVRIGPTARIRISDAIANEGRRRFSIAHELGHLWLGHRPRSFAELCSAVAIEGRPARIEEAEASAFAAELLIPSAIIGTLATSAPPDMAIAREIARTCGVSLTAAARRLIELSPYACALTLCHRGRIRWATRSATFGAFLPRDRVPGAETAVVEHLAWSTVPRGPRRVPASDWLGATAERGAMLMEDAAALTGGDDVLTILVVEGPFESTAPGK